MASITSPLRPAKPAAPTRIVTRQKAGNVQRERHEPEYAILLAIVALTAVGILMVYSSSAMKAYLERDDTFAIVGPQIVWGALGGTVSSGAVDVLALALLGVVTLWLVVRRAAPAPVSTVWSIVIIFATFMLVSRKSYSSYLVMAFFPVCMLAASSTSAWFSPAGFGLFGLAAMIERTLWFRWLDASRSANTVAQLQAAGPLRAIVFLAAEAVLVATYVRLWQEAYAFLTRGQTVSQSAPDIEASLAVQH